MVEHEICGPRGPATETYYSRHLQAMYDSIPGEWPADDDGKTRFRKWLFESLLCGLGELERGDVKVAFRCLLQAREYCGRIGGYWPSPVSHDAAIFLQNTIEDHISKASAQ